jgi:hypothetical protein
MGNEMAEPITRQELEDGSADLATVETAVNADDNTDVVSRLGRTYPALAKAMRLVLESRAKAYLTQSAALADTANLRVNQAVEVTNDSDTAKNGLYQWDGTTLTKSTYDPLNQSKAYADANRLFKPVTLTAAADFNTLTIEGRTVVPTDVIAAACTNRPSDSAGILDVARIGDGVLHTYRVFEFDLAYERQKLSGGTWTDWVQLASKDMIDTTAANTLQGAKDYADANPLFKPSARAASVDLDTVTTAGFYLLSATPTSYTAQHYPVNLNGFLHVYYAASTGSTQLAQMFMSANGKCFVRYRAGSTFTAWYNDYDAVLTYLQTAVQTISTINIVDGTDLNTIQTSGFYAQNVSASATALSNYPVTTAGAGFLSVVKFNSSLIYQSYQVRDTAKVYRRVYTGTWTAWVDAGLADLSVTKPKLATALTDQLKKRLEFFPVGAANGVTYNSATKTLSWPHMILAASAEYAATLRLRIPAGSVTFTGSGYEVLYIDLSLVPADGSLVNLTPLKIASYASSGFLDKFDQVPLAKLDISGKIYPCAGFLPISDGSAVTGGSKDTFKLVKAATTAYFYLPTSIGKSSRVHFYRQQVAFNTSVANSQSDVWRLADVYECDATTLAEQRYIVVDGEWDTALRVTGAADHSGGVHGDELQTSSYFLIDGCYYAQDAVITTDVRELIFVQQSSIYFENTTTVLAERTKIMTVTKSGIKNRQKIVFKSTASLFTAWVTMLPIKRKSNDDNTGAQITDKVIRFPDYVAEDVSSTAFTMTYTDVADGDYVVLSSVTSGISAKVKLSGFKNLPSPTLHISNAGFYNKLYFSAIDSRVASYNVTVNETWQIDSEFVLNIK